MQRENKVIWLVKVQNELDLAKAATDRAKAAYHSERAREFRNHANAVVPPDAPDDLDLP